MLQALPFEESLHCGFTTVCSTRLVCPIYTDGNMRSMIRQWCVFRAYFMSPNKRRRLQLASSVLLEDAAIEAGAPRVQNHIRVNLPMRMVPLLHSQTITSAPGSAAATAELSPPVSWGFESHG